MEPSGVTSFPRTRFLAAACALVSIVLVAGCGSAGPSGATIRPATAAPSEERSPADTESPPPSEAPTPAGSISPGLFEVVGAEGVIRRTIIPERGAILPGAITVDGGTWHAWVVAFSDQPGVQDLHHLTSPNGSLWIESPDESLEGLSEGLGNPGAVPTSVFADGDGWVMFYTGTPVSRRAAWEIRRATAPGPGGPWTADEDPVIERGPSGAWDAGTLDFPTVLRTDDGFLAFYSGVPPGFAFTGAVGRATSPDGITWIKHDDPATTNAERAESDPVLEPGFCGGFDAGAVHQPRVIVDGDRLVMAYAGYDGMEGSMPGIGLAVSDDLGLAWRCAWPGSALETEGLPAGQAHTLNLVRVEDRLVLFVEWLANDGTDVWRFEADLADVAEQRTP